MRLKIYLLFLIVTEEPPKWYTQGSTVEPPSGTPSKGVQYNLPSGTPSKVVQYNLPSDTLSKALLKTGITGDLSFE